MSARFTYETCCVNCPDLEALSEAIDNAREVSYATLRKHIADLSEWAEGMGYALNKRYGLTLARDYHVRFQRSRYQGRRCYMIVHSAIEHIFTEGQP